MHPRPRADNDRPVAAWYEIANADEVPSPALLVYPERADANVRRMIALAGGPERLRPHVKTHKLAELVRRQQAFGIRKFKCATIAEAEMLGGCGAQHVLLAYQPVGPNIRRLLELTARFPSTRFAALTDNAACLRALNAEAHRRGAVVECLLDIDCGMGRTGIAADAPGTWELYQLLATLPGITPGGLHAYDGHIVERDPIARDHATREALAPAHALRQRLLEAGLPVPRMVVGGSPTFPTHARQRNVECSPGTTVLWDAGYATEFPDLDFAPAATVLARVVSKPGRDRVCIDLGYKAVASETSRRAVFPQVPDAAALQHSEEHLVLGTRHAAAFTPGDVLYAVPWHICPTVALYGSATVVRDGRAVGRWPVTARERTLTI